MNKPRGLTSNAVLQTIKSILETSELFSTFLARKREWIRREKTTKNWRKRKMLQSVKMGHGGTLDPMATGVLVLAIEDGTKSIASFLDCTKTYIGTALFGSSTDSYDANGKLLHSVSYGHITKPLIEECLSRFRGDIQQTPPIYSALRMDGMRLYDYARAGKPLPRPIEKRPVTVSELEILEFLPQHNFEAPKEEADEDMKKVDRMVHGAAQSGSTAGDKRKTEEESPPAAKRIKLDEIESSMPPAVKLRCTVSSGTYIRSLIHDIGEAVGSAAHLVQLERTRQGEFELGKNVIEYEDFLQGRWHDRVDQAMGWKDVDITHQSASG